MLTKKKLLSSFNFLASMANLFSFSAKYFFEIHNGVLFAFIGSARWLLMATKMTKVSQQKKDFHMTTKTIQTLQKNNVLKNL